MNDVAEIDRALDETLVSLGAIVLRLSDPTVTRTPAERAALARSVAQFGRCAERSVDPRIHALREQLQATVKPNLRLVSSRT